MDPHCTRLVQDSGGSHTECVWFSNGWMRLVFKWLNDFGFQMVECVWFSNGWMCLVFKWLNEFGFQMVEWVWFSNGWMCLDFKRLNEFGFQMVECVWFSNGWMSLDFEWLSDFGWSNNKMTTGLYYLIYKEKLRLHIKMVPTIKKGTILMPHLEHSVLECVGYLKVPYLSTHCIGIL